MVDDSSIPPIVERLRIYVAERPGAVDSIRGIREWWLAGLEPPPTIEALTAALLQLELVGLFEAIELPDGEVLWRAVQSPR